MGRRGNCPRRTRPASKARRRAPWAGTASIATRAAVIHFNAVMARWYIASPHRKTQPGWAGPLAACMVHRPENVPFLPFSRPNAGVACR